MDELLNFILHTSMGFKEWLLLEDGFDDSGSEWFYGNMLLPSDAGDWPYAWPFPADFALLQARWQLEKGEGRKFYNLDLGDVSKTEFLSLKSETMPDSGDGFWRHKEDKRPNVTVEKHKKLERFGYQEKSKQVNKLMISNNLLDKTKELNRLFGDFKPKYPTLSSDFDKPWIHNENITPYQVFGPGTRNFTNDKMGIPSRLLGPDETGEREQKKHVKTANFGFGRRKRRWKKIDTIS